MSILKRHVSQILMTSSKPVKTLQQTTALTFLSNEKQEPFTRNIQFSISATFYGKNQGSIYISFLFDDNDELLHKYQRVSQE